MTDPNSIDSNNKIRPDPIHHESLSEKLLEQMQSIHETHFLIYMAGRGYNVPKSTPSRKEFLELEKQFLALAKTFSNTVSEFVFD